MKGRTENAVKNRFNSLIKKEKKNCKIEDINTCLNELIRDNSPEGKIRLSPESRKDKDTVLILKIIKSKEIDILERSKNSELMKSEKNCMDEEMMEKYEENNCKSLQHLNLEEEKKEKSQKSNNTQKRIASDKTSLTETQSLDSETHNKNVLFDIINVTSSPIDSNSSPKNPTVNTNQLLRQQHQQQQHQQYLSSILSKLHLSNNTGVQPNLAQPGGSNLFLNGYNNMNYNSMLLNSISMDPFNQARSKRYIYFVKKYFFYFRISFRVYCGFFEKINKTNK